MKGAGRWDNYIPPPNAQKPLGNERLRARTEEGLLHKVALSDEEAMHCDGGHLSARE
jgi:hypothetical protein